MPEVMVLKLFRVNSLAEFKNENLKIATRGKPRNMNIKEISGTSPAYPANLFINSSTKVGQTFV